VFFETYKILNSLLYDYLFGPIVLQTTQTKQNKSLLCLTLTFADKGFTSENQHNMKNLLSVQMCLHLHSNLLPDFRTKYAHVWCYTCIYS
jgi:hypothetical protein